MTSPPPKKVYVYGEIRFELFAGGQPDRRFNIKWGDRPTVPDKGRETKLTLDTGKTSRPS